MSTTFAQHALTCPKCAGEMRTYERNGVVIDQCRDCRGLFLDRGELERLVDLEGGATAPTPEAWASRPAPDGPSRSGAPASPADPRSPQEARDPRQPAKPRSLFRDLLEGFGE